MTPEAFVRSRTSQIVSAYLGRNPVPSRGVAAVIATVGSAIAQGLATGPDGVELAERPTKRWRQQNRRRER